MTPPPLVLAVTHRHLRLHPHQKALPHPPPTAVSWFPTGNFLVTSNRASLTFLTSPSLAALGEISPSPPSTAHILSVSLSPASRFLAVGRSDGVVSVLDLASKAPVASFTLSAPVISVSFQRSPDARYLACATASAVSLFSRVSNRLVARFAVASSPRNASFSAGRQRRLSPGATAGAKITNVAFSPAHLNLLVATDESGCLNVWDVARNVAPRPRTEPKLAALQQHDTYSRFTTPFRAPAAALSFAPKTAQISLCVGGFDKQLRFFDPSLKRICFSVSCPAPVSAVSFASDGRHLAVGLTNGKMQILTIDSENESAKLVSEVVVDGDDAEEPTAVRSVHFQPTDAVDSKADKSITEGLQNFFKRTERPFSLSGSAKGSSSMTKHTAATRNGNASYDSDSLFAGFGDESDDFEDALEGHLEVVSDPTTTPARALRSASGPRDSDIFSPVAPTPRANQPSSRRVTKSTSFHESPQTVGRKAHITFRTPRSRTAQPITPLNEKIEAITLTDAAERDVPACDSDHQADYKDIEALHIDSDSLDSLSGRLPPKSGSSIPKRGYVSQPQGSTFSDDIGNAFSDEREGSRSPKSDLSPVPSALTRSENEVVASNSTENPKPSTAFSRSSSHGYPASATDKPSFPRFYSVPDKMTRPASNVTFESPRSRQGGSPADASLKGITPRHQRETVAQPAANGIVKPQSAVPDNLAPSLGKSQTLDGAPSWLAGFRDELRQMMSQELDVVKADLRSDVLNIHSEMIVTSARQSQEFKAAFLQRDRRVKQLEKEVHRLHEDNERLRRQYGLP